VYALLGVSLLALLEPYVWLGALAAELGAHFLLLTMALVVACVATRDWLATGVGFFAAVFLAGPLAPLYREVRPTPEYGPLVRVAHVHDDAQPLGQADLATWLGSARVDVAAVTGLRAEDARPLPPHFSGFRVYKRMPASGNAQALFVREALQTGAKVEQDGLLSAWLKVGRCQVRAVAVELPSRLAYATLSARATQIAALASTRSMARSVWLGHLGSRAEASDLAALREPMELRDSRRGEGRLSTYPAGLGALGVPLDHVLVHGWLGVRARSTDAGITALSHRTVRATLELTEPRCRP
jgi:hypothetical protein